MKINTITLHGAHNFGAMLQAFALKDYLSQQGHEVSIIDFLHPSVTEHNRHVKFSTNPKTLVRSAMALPAFFFWKRRFQKFEAFKNETMNLTRRYTSIAEVQNDPPQADAYICGSDQIWNPERNFNPLYMLDFGDSVVKRISYAASLGVDSASEEKLKELGEYLDRFDAISVRETSGAQLVAKAGKKAEVVVDPSLLLDQDQWKKIAVPYTGTGKYILTYCLEESEEFNAVLKKVADETGLPVVRVGGAVKNRITPVNHFIRDAGPYEFLGLLLNAEYIVTNSFHGTAFALNLGKPLVGIRHSCRNARMTTLLNSLGWPDSQVGNESTASDILEIANTRANEVNESSLVDCRKVSVEFLQQSLS